MNCLFCHKNVPEAAPMFTLQLTHNGILRGESLIHENCYPKILEFRVTPLPNGEFIAFDVRKKAKNCMPMTRLSKPSAARTHEDETSNRTKGGEHDAHENSRSAAARNDGRRSQDRD